MELFLGSIELGGLAITSYYLSNLSKRYQRLTNVIGYMEGATVFTPSVLESVMRENGLQLYRSSLMDFEETSTYALGKGFVKGIVECSQPLKSLLGNQSELVVSQVTKESIFSSSPNPNILESSFKVVKNMVSNFNLVDQNGGKIKLANNKRISYFDALKLVDSISYLHKMTGLDKLISSLMSHFELFFSINKIGGKGSSLKVGSRKIERGISVGQEFIAYGQIFYDRMNGKLRMDNPQFYISTKKKLINLLKGKETSFTRNLILLSIIFVTFALLVYRRFKKNQEAYKKQQEILWERARRDKLNKVSSLSTDSLKCVRCRYLVRNVIFKPCLHMVVCSECIGGKKDIVTCPYCLD